MLVHVYKKVAPNIKYEAYSSIYFWGGCLCKIFRLWPRLTSNKLWPKKNLGFVWTKLDPHSTDWFHPSCTFWVMCFTRFPDLDHCWPLNDIWLENNRFLIITKVDKHILIMKFIQALLLELCFQCFSSLWTSNDLDLYRKK